MAWKDGQVVESRKFVEAEDPFKTSATVGLWGSRVRGRGDEKEGGGGATLYI